MSYRNFDLYCFWAGDCHLTADGDILVAYDWEAVEQQVIRLMLTNFQTVEPSGRVIGCDYIFHSDFGLGFRAFLGELGQPDRITRMQSTAIQALKSNPLVSANPAPVVKITLDNAAAILYVAISLTLADGEEVTNSWEIVP